jgi:hypothetical protein
MPSTYEPIANGSITFNTTTSSHTFNSIPATYTDLVCVVSGSLTSLQDFSLQFNGDTGANYSITYAYGAASTTTAGYENNQTAMTAGSLGADQSTCILQIQSYSNPNVTKPVLSRAGGPTWVSFYKGGLWRSTSAINSIKFTGINSFTSGTSITLYGIKAA